MTPPNGTGDATLLEDNSDPTMHVQKFSVWQRHIGVVLLL
jgi:hypothetical protein